MWRTRTLCVLRRDSSRRPGAAMDAPFGYEQRNRTSGVGCCYGKVMRFDGGSAFEKSFDSACRASRLESRRGTQEVRAPQMFAEDGSSAKRSAFSAGVRRCEAIGHPGQRPATSGDGNRRRSQCGPRSIHGCVAGVGQTEGEPPESLQVSRSGTGVEMSLETRHAAKSARATPGAWICPLRHNVRVKVRSNRPAWRAGYCGCSVKGHRSPRKRQLRMWRTHSLRAASRLVSTPEKRPWTRHLRATATQQD